MKPADKTLPAFVLRGVLAFRRAIATACIAVLAVVPLGAWAQKTYSTPEAAADALVDAVMTSDENALKAVLGANYAKVLPVRAVDTEDVTAFLAGWAKRHGIERRDDNTVFLEIDDTHWALPIPIARSKAGWSFDTLGTNEELRTRRIGRNELAVMHVALAYTDAQEEYFEADPDGDGVKAFATRLLSSKGKRDGLYWPALGDEPLSPLGPIKGFTGRNEAYYGYFYRVLTAQGKSAPGGAKDYFRNGRLTEGFALVAWPARYGDTGVKTFIVNRDGAVYEKDLGSRTDAIARTMKAYDPDPSWTKSDIKD
jgi:hypothetical protein